MTIRACFMDRDGVVNEEVNYLSDPAKVVLVPGTSEAINLLHAAGYIVIVVTNQAGVAKGYFEESAIGRVHARIAELLHREGAWVDEFYYCPHHPDYTGVCNCRKPAPGMLLAAIEKYGIDPDESFLIGDRPSDIAAGRNANLAESYLVLTGYGSEVVSRGDAEDFIIATTPLLAVRDFLARRNFAIS